ncbi:MAG: CRISPR-associated helicase Cas3' [bacterium]
MILYSHFSNTQKKDLKVHLKSVATNSRNVLLNKDLSLSYISKQVLADISYLIGIAHDFGKTTTFFQNYLVYKINNNFSHHGLISALLGYLLIKRYCDDQIIPLIAYMVIKKHHGNIESPLEDPGYTFGDLSIQLKDIKENNYHKVQSIYKELFKGFDICFGEVFDEIVEIAEDDPEELIDDFDDIIFEDVRDEEESIEVFLITNLLYSILIDCDKKDAARINNSYFTGAIKENFDVYNYINHCRKKDPIKFSLDKPINRARNNFFDEVINNSQIKKNNYLYSLTAPTGIGKTYVSFAFANKLKLFYAKGRRVIYCLPYTSIIDQNYKELEEIISHNLNKKYEKNPTKYLLKHHYLMPMQLLKDVNNNSDSKDTINLNKYFEDKLLLESWETGNIVTTFVQLFESIIGNKNSYLKKFHNIINSIIILDEIQNVPAKYYKIIGKVFQIMAKSFNTHILLLTATQPEIIQRQNHINLVIDEKYAKQEVFNRTEVEIVDNLNELSLDDFLVYFIDTFNEQCGLIVTNTITSALTIYKELIMSKSVSNYQIYSLTTYLTPEDRINRIKMIEKKIKNGEKIIVVSTQLIEAGVDLSFTLVYRDLGPLDSIIQVAGRCNRNGELYPEKGKVKIVQLKKDQNSKPYCKKVYDPLLVQFSEEVLKDSKYYNGSKVIEAKQFIYLSKEYFLKIRNKIQRDADQLLESIKSLDYSGVNRNNLSIKDFKLIEYQSGKEDIIICQCKSVENKINKLEVLYDSIKKTGENNEEANKVFAEIELIKKDLAKYKVSVYSNDLDKYNNYYIIKEFKFIKYVSYKDQKKYLYDKNIGFCKSPKKPFQPTVFA